VSRTKLLRIRRVPLDDSEPALGCGRGALAKPPNHVKSHNRNGRAAVCARAREEFLL
jgi:hypothetical protein